VLKGVMFNKDVVVPGRMRRKIINPRIMLLDCPLEYKKGENQTNVEITKVCVCVRVFVCLCVRMRVCGCGCGSASCCLRLPGLQLSSIMGRGILCGPRLSIWVAAVLCGSRLSYLRWSLPRLRPPAPTGNPQEEDWAALLKAEEDQIQRMCEKIISFKPDLVVTEKGLSDLCAHFLTKVGGYEV
jgi:hypothetical protein